MAFDLRTIFILADPLNNLKADAVMATPSKSQYDLKLPSWGVSKYLSGGIWSSVASEDRKRSLEGKDSDFAIHSRKYTRRKINKEIARHVKSCNLENAVLPDYITVSTPPAESVGTFREFLLRNLPWYRYTQELQTLGKCLVAIYDILTALPCLHFENGQLLLFQLFLNETNKMSRLGRTTTEHHPLNH